MFGYYLSDAVFYSALQAKLWQRMWVILNGEINTNWNLQKQKNVASISQLKAKWPFKQETSDIMLPVCMQAHSSLERDGFVFLSCWVPFEQRSALRRVFVLLCSAN